MKTWKKSIIGIMSIIIILFGFAIISCGDNNDPIYKDVIDITNYYNANGDLLWYYKYEYDSKGNMTKQSYFDANGDLDNYFVFEYDSKGNRIKESYFNANGNLTIYVVNVYKVIVI